jgi:hypothetical protein
MTDNQIFGLQRKVERIEIDMRTTFRQRVAA